MAKQTRKKSKKTTKKRVTKRKKKSEMIGIWFVLGMVVVFLGGLVFLVDWVQRTQGYPSLLGFKSVVETPPIEQTHYTNEPIKVPTPSVKRKPPSKPVTKSTPRINQSSIKAYAAIIIDDMGADKIMARQLLDLDIPVSFSVLPSLKYTQEIAETVFNEGQALLLHIPMEAINHEKMHSNLTWIRVGMKEQTITDILDSLFHEIKYARGANNHTGSRLTAHKKEMDIVLTYMKKKGYFFVDSRTTTKTVAYNLAQAKQIPSAKRDVFFDNEDSIKAITHEFERFVKLALTNGKAIGIGHPKQNTLTVLKKFIPLFKEKMIMIVPVTDLLTPDSQINYMARKQ